MVGNGSIKRARPGRAVPRRSGARRGRPAKQGRGQVAVVPTRERIVAVAERLFEARRSLRDIHEEYRLLTAEQVWNESLRNGLFLESEKKAVYEDQGEAVKDLEREVRELRRTNERAGDVGTGRATLNAWCVMAPSNAAPTST